MIYAVEYSMLQDAFHIEEIDRLAEINRDNITRAMKGKGGLSGFIPVAFMDSRGEAELYCQELRSEYKRINRQRKAMPPGKYSDKGRSA